MSDQEQNTTTPLNWKQVAEFPEAKLLVTYISEEGKAHLKFKVGDEIANEPNILKNISLGKVHVKPLLISLRDITDEQVKEYMKVEATEEDLEEEFTEEEIEETKKELTTRNRGVKSFLPCITVHEANWLKHHNYDIYWWKAQDLCEYQY